ncbi:YfiR family protein [Chryseosolibacter indicus]|uniref:DUF4154 domain-containing protein n=1 Tax=Chryseosolibacter indicus TaxID=2782351 RepID=A0ABS5VMP2_9BACT|nr:YfiR family protein [Chryseosolibacter indicus]MBT1702119.1 DUF4154 domain-containing protein [Chryseosolibacter indicus]
MNRIRSVISAIAFTFGSFFADAQTTNYQVHSLFIINIAKYSTWPAHGTEFQITVFGKSKLFDELIKQSTGKNINGATIKVTLTENLIDIGTPHIIVLADGKSGSLSDILKTTQGKPTMVIAEREGLFRKGAGFSFVVMDDNTLRYDINNGELEKRQIKVSKNLVGLANATL